MGIHEKRRPAHESRAQMCIELETDIGLKLHQLFNSEVYNQNRLDRIGYIENQIDRLSEILAEEKNVTQIKAQRAEERKAKRKAEKQAAAT